MSVYAELALIASLVMGYSSPPVITGDALVIANCESGNGTGDGSYNLTAKNPNSTASGIWQFLDGTWESVTGLPAPASAYSLETQLEAFEKLYDNGAGRSHWNASRSCWRHKL